VRNSCHVEYGGVIGAERYSPFACNDGGQSTLQLRAPFGGMVPLRKQTTLRVLCSVVVPVSEEVPHRRVYGRYVSVVPSFR
jgi:hypothetical protein